MILLIDNYDSFSYNLYQLIGTERPDIRVIRNDELTPEEIAALRPDAVVLSPGPGRPEEAGCCVNIVRRLGETVPLLGVCLGHQAICAAFGATVSHAKRLMHGKQSVVKVRRDSRLFADMPERLPVARYHSLAVEEETLPDNLRVTAWTDDGEVMAVEHTAFPVCGVQFHPESILTPDGRDILKNFLALTV